jgi:hypothetical protein
MRFRDKYRASDRAQEHNDMVTAINPSPAALMEDISFIQDMARFGEGSMSERRIRKKWGFTDATWDQLGENEDLIEAIELEKERRVRNGYAAREKAQEIFAGAPAVLGGILHDGNASPRHRIESAKELRAISANGPEATSPADRFQIVINLGADTVLSFDKPRAIGPDDPDRVDVAALAAISAKPTDGGNGQPL